MDITTALGLTAASCTTFSFLPQTVKTIKSGKTGDLSLSMYAVLTLGIFLWLIYGLLIKDWPMIFANAITLVFTSTILFLIIKNKASSEVTK